MKTPEIDIIATFLSEVHSHSLAPFYRDNSEASFFDSLPEKSENSNDVDKIFFRNMAEALNRRIIAAQRR